LIAQEPLAEVHEQYASAASFEQHSELFRQADDEDAQRWHRFDRKADAADAKRKKRSPRNFLLAAIRYKELRNVCAHTGMLPIGDEAEIRLEAIARALFHFLRARDGKEPPWQQIVASMEQWYPGALRAAYNGLPAPLQCDPRDVEGFRRIAPDAARRAIAQPKLETQDKLARIFGVDDRLRQKLKLTQVGAIDIPRNVRVLRAKARKRHRDRESAAARRAAEGATPRSQSKARLKPWIALGISESTYYRRQRRDHGLSAMDVAALPASHLRRAWSFSGEKDVTVIRRPTSTRVACGRRISVTDSMEATNCCQEPKKSSSIKNLRVLTTSTVREEGPVHQAQHPERTVCGRPHECHGTTTGPLLTLDGSWPPLRHHGRSDRARPTFFCFRLRAGTAAA
jgi:hypothetical protein